MSSHLVHYWKWDVANRAREFETYEHSAGEVLRTAKTGDHLWVFTSNRGRLYLVQNFRIASAGLSRQQAARRLKVTPENLWDAKWHVVGDGVAVWPQELIDVHDLAPKLKFVSKRSPHLKIVSGKLDPQTLRSLRRLDRASAEMLLGRWQAVVGSRGDRASDEFDPAQADARTQRWALQRIRQGQGRFRLEVLDAYGGACCISGYDAPEALDAAHIVDYRGPKTNVVQNGLLLRSDLHALFDFRLIAINPDTLSVAVAKELIGTAYEQFNERKVRLPRASEQAPSVAALRQHFIGSKVIRRKRG